MSQGQGNQIISFAFSAPASARVMNQLTYKLVPSGIYEGGLLQHLGNNTQVVVSPFTLYVEDPDYVVPGITVGEGETDYVHNIDGVAVRIQSQDNATITFTTENGVANPYIVGKYTWDTPGQPGTAANYLQITNESKANVDANPQWIVFGKLIWDLSSGQDLTTDFDYDYRSVPPKEVLENQKEGLRVRSQIEVGAGNTVHVNEGDFVLNGKLYSFAGGTSPVITATPAGNSRIDLVVIDPTSLDIEIVLGTAGVTVPPEYPYGKLTVAEIHRDADIATINGTHIKQVAGFSGVNEYQFNDGNELQMGDSLTVTPAGRSTPFTFSINSKVTAIIKSMVNKIADGTLVGVGVEDTQITTNQRVVSLIEANLVNVDVRNTIQTGPIDSDGLADFLQAGTGLQVDTKDIDTTSMNLAFADGFIAQGMKNLIVQLTENYSFTSLADNTTNYLYFEYDEATETLSTGSTIYAPIYSDVRPASPASTNQFWYPLNHRTSGEYWDAGTTSWIPVLRIFVGEAVTASDSVSSVESYKYLTDNSKRFISGAFPLTRTETLSGSGTWTVPDNVYTVQAFVSGGGGGGVGWDSDPITGDTLRAGQAGGSTTFGAQTALGGFGGRLPAASVAGSDARSGFTGANGGRGTIKSNNYLEHGEAAQMVLASIDVVPGSEISYACGAGGNGGGSTVKGGDGAAGFVVVMY